MLMRGLARLGAFRSYWDRALALCALHGHGLACSHVAALRFIVFAEKSSMLSCKHEC